MTMVSSGNVSLGGNVVVSGLNQSVEYELFSAGLGYVAAGNSQISFNDSAVRTLTGTVANAQVSFLNVYGKSAFTPVTNTYVSGSGVDAIPTYASTLKIEIWGGGGGGGRGSSICISNDGGGGGGGGYSTKTFSLTSADWGKTINYIVGSGGSAGTVSGGNGTSSSITNGTFSSAINMVANGGNGGSGGISGGIVGAGGTASGGTTNTTGGGDGVSATKTGQSSPNGGGLQTISGGKGNAPGGGGAGSNFGSNPGLGGAGANGQARFSYT